MSACLRSGYCCKKAPCPYGKSISDTNLACRYQGGDKPGEYFCKKYNEIILDETSWISPAFGSGCSSPLNSDRLQIKKKAASAA
jgi:hypothetical protein